MQNISDAAMAIKNSGLFDIEWFLNEYPDMVASGMDPIEHFLAYGEKEGRHPNFLFSSNDYLVLHPDVKEAGMSPLLHYATQGWKEMRRCSYFFEQEWYVKKYGVDPLHQAPLAHYLANRRRLGLSPNSVFDIDYYSATNPDVMTAGIDPYEHFMRYGYKEGRAPSADFHLAFYRQVYMGGGKDINPVAHYLAVGKARGHRRNFPAEVPTVARVHKKNTERSEFFETHDPTIVNTAPKKAKALAFYLPQFHPFPENDEWWGDGFTEWTNIPKGVPRYAEQYQPRIPRDLSHYNLTDVEAIKKQVEYAVSSGLYGFCHYFYWFNQRRLLDRPLDLYLEHGEIDFPFMLLWANENWTRRWDGQDKEMLLRQNYAEEDEEPLVECLIRYFADPRYIRIAGRPLFVIYRADIIPGCKEFLDRMRALFQAKAGYVPHLFMAQSFHCVDPYEWGFDGAIEFPPHKLGKYAPDRSDAVTMLDWDYTGEIKHYDDFVAASLQETAPAYPLFKTIFPNWDNNARRPLGGLSVYGSTPPTFQRWTAQICDYARRNRYHDEAFFFINAWNEWCEGAYLEPDVHYGAAYLNSLARALTIDKDKQKNQKMHVLLVGHDAFPSGAQMLLYNIARTLKRNFGVVVSVILQADGALRKQYEALCQTHVLSDGLDLDVILGDLVSRGYSYCLTNTVVTGALVPHLKKYEFKVVSLIHELPSIISTTGNEINARNIATSSDRVVFPNRYVGDRYVESVGAVSGHACIRPQGIYNHIEYDYAHKAEVYGELGLSGSDRLVINLGYADLRKGFDKFVECARVASRKYPDLHFLWVGDIDSLTESWILQPQEKPALRNFHHVARTKDVARYLSASDAFFLSSREDPFPSVVLEALSIGLKVFAFDDGGGYVEIAQESSGKLELIPRLDPSDIVATIHEYVSRLDDGACLDPDSEVARHITDKYRFDDYCFDLLIYFKEELRKLSVVIPNYNYAHCLRQRLESVFHQVYPIYEVLVLDDCSTDGSIFTAEVVSSDNDRQVSLVINERNSGSVFRQWKRGADLARGDYLWIAEADDSSSELFASTLMEQHANQELLFAFSDSSAITKDNLLLYPDYKAYYQELVPGTLQNTEIFDAQDFVRNIISVRNLILNVSAVIWQRKVLEATMSDLGDALYEYRIAGDWLIYAQSGSGGGYISYVETPLNIHRRHSNSVTHATNKARHLTEVRGVHGFINTHFVIPTGVREVQESYLARLIAQFDSE